MRFSRKAWGRPGHCPGKRPENVCKRPRRGACLALDGRKRTSELDIPEEVVLAEPMRLSGYACQAMAVQPHDGTRAEDIFLSFCDRYVAFIAQNNDSCAAKLQGQAAVFLNKHSSWNVLSLFSMQKIPLIAAILSTFCQIQACSWNRRASHGPMAR